MATSRPSKFPRVPYAQIRWLVGKLHVGDSDVEVSSEIESRLRRRRGDQFKATEAEVREAVRYALACHLDNRREYVAVMRGIR